MAEPWEERFLEEEGGVQVVMTSRLERMAYLGWLRSRGLSVFPIPHEGADGKLTLDSCEDDLRSYAVQSNG
jgi:hypothetical protein